MRSFRSHHILLVHCLPISMHIFSSARLSLCAACFGSFRQFEVAGLVASAVANLYALSYVN